ncbi:hypothetical protein [Microbispora sp. NPDC049633]|uniref:hypothetical protein n=1 Tax=Microbispora sp. NPDC049633 TaxID=3154355 RepID=UPI00341F71ED
MKIDIKTCVSAIVVAAVVLAAAVACGNTPAVADNPKPPVHITTEAWYEGSEVDEALVHLSDGTVVTCVSVYKGGLSCDWPRRSTN